MPDKVNKSGHSLNVPVVPMEANIFIVDVRHAELTAHLHGIMKMPSLVREKGQKISWRFPQLVQSPKGVVTDVAEGQISAVFIFADKSNGIKTQDGSEASFEELIHFFRWFAPELQLIPDTDLRKFYKET